MGVVGAGAAQGDGAVARAFCVMGTAARWWRRSGARWGFRRAGALGTGALERGGGDAPHAPLGAMGSGEAAARGRVLWAVIWVGIYAACGARGACVQRGTRALTASVPGVSVLSSSGLCARWRGGTRTTSATSWPSMVSCLRARPPATHRRATARGVPANQRKPREVVTARVGAGLKLDDVRNEWHPDVQTAISRLSPEELSNRNKRLKRAMDLSLKHSELNKEAQAAVEPLVGYLPLERAREERLERCLPFQPPASFPSPRSCIPSSPYLRRSVSGALHGAPAGAGARQDVREPCGQGLHRAGGRTGQESQWPRGLSVSVPAFHSMESYRVRRSLL